VFTLAIFDLFWLSIYPSENFCVDCGAFYVVEICVPSSSVSIETFLHSLNARLQARAACGASLCKPLFGGIGA